MGIEEKLDTFVWKLRQIKFTKQLFYRCNFVLIPNYTQRLGLLKIEALQYHRRHEDIIMIYMLFNNLDCGDILDTF